MVKTMLPAPQGYEVDFDNPQRQAVPAAYWVSSFGVAFSILFMGQRLFVKLKLGGGMQTDDYVLVVAWLLAMVVVGLCVVQFVRGSGGVHAWETPIEKYQEYALGVYLASWIYVIAGSLAKIALLIFYLRLSPSPWFRWSVWGTMIFIGGYTIGIACSLIFACKPIRKAWDISIPLEEGSCINQPAMFIVTAVVNIVSDVILFCLPIPMVYNLQIPRRQKLGLLAIFSVGSMTIVTSIVRVTILPQMLTDPDATWTISWASVWIIVEANLLIICAALPTLRKFFHHVAPHLIGEYSSRGGSRSNGLSHPKDPNTATIGGSTFGQSSRRGKNQYSQFDVDEGNDPDDVPMRTIRASRQMQSSNKMPSDETVHEWGDGDSEKAIMSPTMGAIRQTTTVQIEFSESAPSHAR